MQSIITAFTFVAVYQLASRMAMRPLVGGGIIAVVPFAFTLAMRIIYGAHLSNLVQWSDICILVLQLIVSFLIFRKLDYDDSPTIWIVWGAAGLITVAVLIPAFVFFLSRIWI